MTLPQASAAASRIVVVGRMDNRGRVVVRPPSGALLGARSGDGVVLERRFDQVMFVSDGTTWIVLRRRTAEHLREKGHGRDRIGQRQVTLTGGPPDPG